MGHVSIEVLVIEVKEESAFIEYDGANYSIPLSQIVEKITDWDEDEFTEITVPEWLAFEKGLI